MKNHVQFLSIFFTTLCSCLFVCNNNAIASADSLCAGFFADDQIGCTGLNVNYTDTSLNSVNWMWTFEGGSPNTFNGQQPPAIAYNNSGTFQTQLIVMNANGFSDTTVQNNFVVIRPNLGYPYSNDFETGVFPFDFSLESDDTSTWKLSNASAFNNGNGSVFFDNYTSDLRGTSDLFVSGQIDLSGAVNPTLRFDLAHAIFPNQALTDTLEILVSADCGLTYTSVWKKGGEELATISRADTGFFVPEGSDWDRADADIRAFAGQQVLIAFRNISGWGNNIYIDNVELDEFSAPDVDFSFKTNRVCKGFAIEFFDESFNRPTAWEWEFEGGTPAVSNEQNPVIAYDTSGTFNVTLRAINAAGDDSITRFNIIIIDPEPEMVDIFGEDQLCIDQNEFYEVPNVLNSTYNWVVTNGGIINGNGTNRLLVSWNGTQGAGIVSVTETNQFGCVGPASIKNVSISRPILTDIVGPTELCQFTLSDFTVSSNLTGPTYDWTVQLGSEVIEIDSTVSVFFDTIGTAVLNVTVSENNACAATSDDFFVEVIPTPLASFDQTKDTVFIEQQGFVQFESTVEEISGFGFEYSYAWDFGDGNSGLGANTQHSYTNVDDYEVELIVDVNNLCFDTTTSSVFVKQLTSLPALFAAQNQPKVYPIPASTTLNVDFSVLPENALAQIFDLNGQLYKTEVVEANLDLDVNQLQNGQYLLLIQNEQGAFLEFFTKMD